MQCELADYELLEVGSHDTMMVYRDQTKHNILLHNSVQGTGNCTYRHWYNNRMKNLL